ncbi:hypothetical protein SCQ32_04820 [Streptococcus canis]|uniref:hypothetical protein n=1 Tax=Streptococcus canis TaxID=1329 RepID=UPI002999C3F2|nr:hypothetical protein [Streptococcus canis]
MKKVLLILLTITSLALVACSSQESLDGEYYWINEHRNDKVLTIKGNKGLLDSEGEHSVTIDKESKTFEISGYLEPTVSYEYKDGVLTANLTGTKDKFYKKGTQAYRDALKNYNYSK